MNDENRRARTPNNLILLEPPHSRLIAFERRVEDLYNSASLKGKHTLLDELDDVIACLRDEITYRR